MPALYFIGYVLLFGGITKLVLDQNPPKWVVVLLIVGFFIGWFIVIGLAMARAQGVHKGGDLASGGIRDGLRLLKSWLVYIAGLALVTGILFLAFEWPRLR